METELKKKRHTRHDGTSGAIYGLAFIGAAVYFVQHATGFWNGVWGFVKAIFWPAVVLWKALELLKM
jgi:hypothetical protein